MPAAPRHARTCGVEPDSQDKVGAAIAAATSGGVDAPRNRHAVSHSYNANLQFSTDLHKTHEIYLINTINSQDIANILLYYSELQTNNSD